MQFLGSLEPGVGMPVRLWRLSHRAFTQSRFDLINVR